MTDEEIKKLSEKTRKEKYCSKFCYKNPPKNAEYPCLREGFCYPECPVTYYDEDIICETNIYGTGFVDGYKAAFDKLIEKIKDMQK